MVRDINWITTKEKWREKQHNECDGWDYGLYHILIKENDKI